MLVSLLAAAAAAAGLDSQVCQIQPPHPTLTQLASPFSLRTFFNFTPVDKQIQPVAPLCGLKFFSVSEVSRFDAGDKLTVQNMRKYSLRSIFGTMFFNQDHLPTVRHE